MTPLLIIKTLEGFVVIEDEDAIRLQNVMVNRVRAFSRLGSAYSGESLMEFVREHFTPPTPETEPKS